MTAERELCFARTDYASIFCDRQPTPREEAWWAARVHTCMHACSSSDPSLEFGTHLHRMQMLTSLFADFSDVKSSLNLPPTRKHKIKSNKQKQGNHDVEAEAEVAAKALLSQRSNAPLIIICGTSLRRPLEVW